MFRKIIEVSNMKVFLKFPWDLCRIMVLRFRFRFLWYHN